MKSNIILIVGKFTVFVADDGKKVSVKICQKRRIAGEGEWKNGHVEPVEPDSFFLVEDVEESAHILDEIDRRVGQYMAVGNS